MKINILVFGSLAEVTGTASSTFRPMKSRTPKTCISTCSAITPGLRNKSFQFAVNQNVAGKGQLLREGDEVALLPPFSGG